MTIASFCLQAFLRRAQIRMDRRSLPHRNFDSKDRVTDQGRPQSPTSWRRPLSDDVSVYLSAGTAILSPEDRLPCSQQWRLIGSTPFHRGAIQWNDQRSRFRHCLGDASAVLVRRSVGRTKGLVRFAHPTPTHYDHATQFLPTRSRLCCSFCSSVRRSDICCSLPLSPLPTDHLSLSQPLFLTASPHPSNQLHTDPICPPRPFFANHSPRRSSS